MERGVLKSNAKGQLKGNWTIAVITFLVGSIILGIVPGILNLVESDGVKAILMIINVLLTGAIVYGMANFSLNFAKGNPISFNDLFAGFNGKVFFKTVGLYILLAIAVTIGFMILVIPGIIICLMYSQAFFILCEDNNKSIIDCLKESSSIMKGHKWEYLVLDLSFILWAILCVVTCGIASLWVVPYQYVTFANYYVALPKVS